MMQLKLLYKVVTVSSAFCWCFIPLDPKTAASNFLKKSRHRKWRLWHVVTMLPRLVRLLSCVETPAQAKVSPNKSWDSAL